jgi:hypothetical protein
MSLVDDHDKTQVPSINQDEIKPSSSSSEEKLPESPPGKGPAERKDYDYMVEKQTEGAAKFHKLGWIKLVVVLIVEAIALGSLSIPA